MSPWDRRKGEPHEKNIEPTSHMRHKHEDGQYSSGRSISGERKLCGPKSGTNYCRISHFKVKLARKSIGEMSLTKITEKMVDENIEPQALSLITPWQRWHIFVKSMEMKGFFQFEISITVLVRYFRFIWIPMLRVAVINVLLFQWWGGGRLKKSESAVCRRQIMTSKVDPTAVRFNP